MGPINLKGTRPFEYRWRKDFFLFTAWALAVSFLWVILSSRASFALWQEPFTGQTPAADRRTHSHENSQPVMHRF